MAPGNPALDMSLDDLIKKARKPAAKKPAAAGAAKKKPAPAAAAAKGGQKQGQQKKPVAGGAKGKLQQQKQQQPQQKQQLGLKAKGGIQKAGGGGAVRPAPGKAQAGQKRADVRVVPRPGASGPNRPGLRPVGRPGAAGPNNRMMGPGPQQQMRQQQGPPRGYGMGGGGMGMGGYGGHPQMMPPGMMQQQPMMMPRMMPQQQPMMQPVMQQQVAPQQQVAASADLFDGSVVSSKTSAKLLVSNLDYKVTDEDIKELFGTVGAIKESYIHYDKNARSVGTATVVFMDRKDALTAFNRYNNVALDNKRMAIEVVEQAVPRGTFKTLSSGINVSRPQAGGAAAAAAAYRGRGVPHGDMMME